MTEPAATSEGLHRRPGGDGEGVNGSSHSTDVEAQQQKTHAGDNAPVVVIEEPEEEKLAQVGYIDILKQFSLLGWVAFGGPAAHIALFQKVCMHISQMLLTSAIIFCFEVFNFSDGIQSLNC